MEELGVGTKEVMRTEADVPWLVLLMLCACPETLVERRLFRLALGGS